jgi:exonuclease SbcD|tara:strand:- start:3247 stop:4449 length:1203 start_codon:yes stop_codon:yes gene_type:complete
MPDIIVKNSACMKLLHTSDWHLGRQFHNVSLLDDQRHVLAQLIEMIIDQSPDVLIIAGDVYDRSVPPASAVTLLDETLHRICDELAVSVIIISGNHDSAERLSFGARQLQRSGLHILGDLQRVTEPVVMTINGVNSHFYGIPYCDPESVRDTFFDELQQEGAPKIKGYDSAHTFLVDKIKAVMPADTNNILISHCFVAGAEESDSERPLSIGGADQVPSAPLLDFDYVALGHLHSPQYRGAQTIRYSGSLLKYSFSEQHQRKSVTKVELSSEVDTVITQLPLQARRDVRILEGELSELIKLGATDEHCDDYLLVRLTDIHAILDPMGKLRQVYPNVLHLERPGLMSEGQVHCARDILKRGSLEMFKDFFTQVSGNQLTEAQSDALVSTISGLEKSAQEQK